MKKKLTKEQKKKLKERLKKRLQKELKKKKKPEKKKECPEVIRPWSLGPCPTAAEVRAAWANRHASTKDFIWLLSVLGELTCFTDCTLKHLGGFGKIAGRQGGLKAWLGRETPELLAKYKSISRHARLATLVRRAFSYYPPAPLSLLHPDLPPPPQDMLDYIRHYAKKLGKEHFQDVAPTYVAFKALADRAFAVSKGRFQRWGIALPQCKWRAAKAKWKHNCVRPYVLRQIRSKEDFYDRTSRTYNPYSSPYEE